MEPAELHGLPGTSEGLLNLTPLASGPDPVLSYPHIPPSFDPDYVGAKLVILRFLRVLFFFFKDLR